MYGLANMRGRMTKPKPIPTARYTRYVVVEFGNGADAKEFFYQLNEQMGYDPHSGHLSPGTGLEWALSQLGSKHANKLKRATSRRATGESPPREHK